MNLKTSYKITIPTKNGFVGRKCSSENCGKYFKIHTSSISTSLICPYCGDISPIEAMWTSQQANYALNVAGQEVMEQVSDEISKMFSNLGRSTRNNKFFKMSYKSSPYRKRYVPAPVEPEVDSEIICSECEGKFQVYGIFGYCPLCKYENIKIYDANLAIIKSEIESSSNQPRALRHAYGDIVSTFESFCKKYADSSANANFQNLSNAKQYFKKNRQVDIYKGINDSEKLKIKRLFLKRHAYTHSEGIITDQYVKEIPEDRNLLGLKAELTLDELLEGSQVLRVIINNIVNQ
jgi:hypothetical protein